MNALLVDRLSLSIPKMPYFNNLDAQLHLFHFPLLLNSNLKSPLRSSGNEFFFHFLFTPTLFGGFEIFNRKVNRQNLAPANAYFALFC